jgi:pSer/pThr/pTyr-binding forkhead associated (FHA) protein
MAIAGKVTAGHRWTHRDIPVRTNPGRTEMSKLVLLGSRKQAKEFDLNRDRIMIGRSSENDIRLVNASVSRHHALIVISMGDTVVEDLNSKNGTHILSKRVEKRSRWENGAAQAYEEVNVNAKRIKKYLLEHGDIIKIGKYRFRFITGSDGLSDTVETERPSLSELEHSMSAQAPHTNIVEVT